MSNSPLVSYTKISPNRTKNRNHVIDTITIHCVVGQVTVERLGEIFANPLRRASSNYGIGSDGRIGMYCEENDRSWCSSNKANDHRAITIEVASDAAHPYRVNDAAFESLINLCADICKRNGIKKLVWSNYKAERVNHLCGCNMTVHRDFANKSCPGEYLYSRHGEIAERVNAILDGKEEIKGEVAKNPYPVPTRTLKRTYPTMKGEDVKWLQTELNAVVYNLEVDGKFGTKTLAAVKDYQKKHGLVVDGKVGSATRKALLEN